MSYEGTNRPHLIVQHTGQVFPLSTQVVTLGTAEDNNIVLADPEVSAHHARISWDSPSGAFFLEDLGSVEGTYVNERAVIGPHRLRDGDEIRLGNTVLDIDLGVAAGLSPEAEQRAPRNTWLVGLVIALLAVATVVCVVLFSLIFWASRDREPNVVIQSPRDGARPPVGSQIDLEVSASGASDITLLEVSIDGILVGTLSSQDTEGTSLLTLSKPWTFDAPGEHEISAEAFTAAGEVGEADPVAITILPAAEASPTPEATATSTPEATPTAEATPTLTPTLEVPTATPLPTVPPPPQIEYFQASPASITAGDCTTLQWGQVNFATQASIQPDLGGIATPGSQQVCPRETTGYTLTAIGPGGTTTATTTVTVVGGLPDLRIDSISFEPSPPVQGQETVVRITIRNAGEGAARPFDWAWQAGSEATFEGRVSGLNPGETTTVTANWTPQNAYDSLATEARVDTKNEVTETDEANNQLSATVRVAPAPPQPQTVVLHSQGSLDGYWRNDHDGNTAEQILVGNGRILEGADEVVVRGFFSFDTSSIPAGATIESVHFEFYQRTIQGDPYQTLGNLVLDQVDYGPSLGDDAYDTPALHSAVLTQMTSANSWYALADPTLSSWLVDSLADGRSRFQLRLRFTQETDGDNDQDLVIIEPGEGPPGLAPRLTIVYRP
ncbi:MAG: CARDB domain-containing protein [Anaerolineae bacterium]